VRKTRVGRVVSDKMDKTRVVVVERAFRHPRYERVVKRTTRFKAHDPTNDSHVGDRVRIVETRPLSKDKRWRIQEILERAG
jgi:small subunit ribosomal protein S17